MKNMDELKAAKRYIEDTPLLMIGGILTTLGCFVGLGWLFLDELGPGASFLLLSMSIIMLIALTAMTFQARRKMKALIIRIEKNES